MSAVAVVVTVVLTKEMGASEESVIDKINA